MRVEGNEMEKECLRLTRGGQTLLHLELQLEHKESILFLLLSHLLVYGILVDGDVLVPVGPVLGVDQAEHVEQLVGDERLPPLGQAAAEGEGELEPHPNTAVVIRTVECLRARIFRKDI